MSFRPLRSVGTGFQALSQRRQPFQPLATEVELEPEPERQEENAGPTPEELLAEQTARGNEEGYEAGYSEGLARGREELDELVGLARELVHELETTRAQMLSSSRNDLVDVLASCLDWLHLATLDHDRDLIVRVVDGVLEDFQGGDAITILVNPADHETLTAELSLGRKAWATWDLTIQPDATVQPGGCLLQAPEGTVDATVEDRLSRLGEELDMLRTDEETTDEVAP